MTSLANTAKYDDTGGNATITGFTIGDTTPPSTPTGLSATAIASSQINLSWTALTDNVGVTGYKIFRDGVQVGTSATNNFSNTGLAASTVYKATRSLPMTLRATTAQRQRGECHHIERRLSIHRCRQPRCHYRESQRPEQRFRKRDQARHGIHRLCRHGHRRPHQCRRLHVVADQLRQRHHRLEYSSYLLATAASASPAVGMTSPEPNSLTLIQQLMQQVQALSLQLRSLQAQMAGAGAAQGN